jgi:hypothetical protein
MQLKIIFKNLVNISELKKLVQRGVSTKEGYHPSQILMAGAWKETRIGKRFCPDMTNLSRAIDRIKVTWINK